jgi:hypothetical protein
VASTPAGRRLTEAQRREQVAISQGFLAEFLALWDLLDVFDLDRTTPGWVRAVMALIELWRTISARSALDYYRDFRRLEVPDADPFPEIIFIDTPSAERAARRAAREAAPSVKRNPAAPRSQTTVQLPVDRSGLVIDWGARRGAVQASSEITGPINIKAKAARGKPLEIAAREALVQASGAAMRHVLDGGRQTNITAMRNDSRMIGWVRVTDGNPCSFCAMLASRGPVYRKDSFASNARNKSAVTAVRRDPRDPGVAFLGAGSFKTHDHCACQMVPVYSTDAAWPGISREMRDLWNANIRGKYSGHDALRAWRRLYEQRQREQGRPTVGFPEAA